MRGNDVMNALDFLNIFSENKKQEELSKMSSKDKEKLINNQKQFIKNYWSNCQTSTDVKLGKTF